MIPYFTLLGLSFLFCFVSKAREKGKLYIGFNDIVSEHSFAVSVFFLMLWILLACRGVEIGKDTSNYELYFNRYNNSTFSQAVFGELEPVFGVLCWLIGKVVHGDFQLFLAVIAAITIIPIALLYNQDRRHSYLKIVLFLNMSVFVMLFSGIRQSVAMSVGLVAYQFVKRKKLVLFIITVLVAMGIHQSAFVLFAMYPLYSFKLKKNHAYIIMPLIGIVFLFNRPIFAGLLTMMSFLGTKYDDYAVIKSTGAITMIICFVAFTLFAYVVPDDKNVDAEFIGMRNYLVMAAILQCFAPLHSLAMRMNYYFILFIPVVIPKVLNYTDARWKEVAKLAEVVLCIFFTIYFVLNVYTGCRTDGGSLHTYPYIPFWAS